MSQSFLDKTGLNYFWQKIVSKFVAKESGKGLSTNDFTTELKNKLDGIAAGANKYTLPTASSTTLGGIKVGSGLSISNGVLSATGGGQSLRVLKEEDGSWVCTYDNDYEFEIQMPESTLFVYLEAGPGDPDFDSVTESQRTKGVAIVIGGNGSTGIYGSSSYLTYSYDKYYPISLRATCVYNINTRALRITNSDNEYFYVSHYKAIGI